ncbi:TPA: hypothetical protein ACGFA2_004490 [Serratia marcescens]|uniref:hypothetical protein n=1 Tax=Serratia marcescens TaxID=615 RepID=UPI0036FA447D
MMKADSDGKPLVKAGTRDCLAIRSGTEADVADNKTIDVLLNDEGRFISLAQGLSVNIPPKSNIPDFLRKPQRKLVCYGISIDVLETHEHLTLIEDSPTHAIIAPRYDMHIQEFERHLEETRPLWEAPDDENDQE